MRLRRNISADEGELGEMGDGEDDIPLLPLLFVLSQSTDKTVGVTECAVDDDATDDERVRGTGGKTGANGNRRALPCLDKHVDDRELEEFDRLRDSSPCDCVVAISLCGLPRFNTGGVGNGRGAPTDPDRSKPHLPAVNGAKTESNPAPKLSIREERDPASCPTSSVAILKLFLRSLGFRDEFGEAKGDVDDDTDADNDVDVFVESFS